MIAGTFDTVAGQTANHVARWNGSTWSPLGSGLTYVGNTQPSSAWALAAMPNGDLIVGGRFDRAGGIAASCIARWNGSSWSPLGAGTSDRVRALLPLPNGELLVGGHFGTAGGLPFTYCLARWNGTAWASTGFDPLPSVFSPWVNALARLPNGDVVVGGQFTSAGAAPQNGLARWDGTTWSALGTGLQGAQGAASWANSLAVQSNGDLAVAGNFATAGGLPAANVARWNGSSWATMGVGPGNETTLGSRAMTTLANGDVVATGAFPAPAAGIARWDGTAWRPLSSGTDGAVLACTTLRNGQLVVAGDFRTIEGVAASHIATWTGSSWAGLGAGLPGTVNAVVELPNGTLVAGGDFTSSGGPNRIARWTGTAWAAMGFANGEVQALLALPNGDLVMAGYFSVVGGVPAFGAAQWNGTTWSALGSPGLSNALALRANGELLLGNAAGVQRWTGAAWVSLGAFGFVSALLALDDGDVVAGFATGIRRWNGTTWTSLGGAPNGAVTCLSALQNGDLLAGGQFTSLGGVAADGLARWDGSAWSAVSSGVDGEVRTLHTRADGSIVVGGEFLFIDGASSAHLARAAATVPATAIPLGAACASPGGPMQLQATHLPWLRSSFAARCTGMAPGALGVALFGFGSPGTPLASLHPAGGPGCTLRADPDAILWVVPTAGVADYAVPLPADLVFTGLVLHTQVGQLQFDVLGNLVGLQSSNGLRLTVGSYD